MKTALLYQPKRLEPHPGYFVRPSRIQHDKALTVILKSQGVTEESGGRGEPAERLPLHQGNTVITAPPRILRSTTTNSA